MATAKKLPSGSWRVRIYTHSETIFAADGSPKEKKIYKSFTCDDTSLKGKRKCEKMALDWLENHNVHQTNQMCFGDAMDAYIAARENILSPRTIRDYKLTRSKYVQSLMPIPIDSLTQDQIQRAINIEAQNLAPKTIKNIHGLISAVLKVYRPSFALNTSLPQKKKVELYIPTDEDIRKLLQEAAGTEMELPILLAAFGPMRRGEICALRSEDISGNIVHVCRNMVLKADSYDWTVKQPKSYAGDRYIDYPDFVAEKWQGIEGRIVNINPNALTSKFKHYLKRAGLPHFRFHDLRHYSASIQHALGIPDSYIMQRGGWNSDGVLKAVYRHALSDKAREMSRLANNHFAVLYDTKYDTKSKNP